MVMTNRRALPSWILVALVTVATPAQGCTGEGAHFSRGLKEAKFDGADAEAAFGRLSPEQLERVFIFSSGNAIFLPVQTQVNGRWKSNGYPKPLSLSAGQRVRVIGRYVATLNRTKGDAFVVTLPDGCGGGAAIRLDRKLPVKRNWVIVEGLVTKARPGNIGRSHDVIPYRLVETKLIAQGREAMNFLVSARLSLESKI